MAASHRFIPAATVIKYRLTPFAPRDPDDDHTAAHAIIHKTIHNDATTDCT